MTGVGRADLSLSITIRKRRGDSCPKTCWRPCIFTSYTQVVLVMDSVPFWGTAWMYGYAAVDFSMLQQLLVASCLCAFW